MTDAEPLLLTRDGAVATLTINRPDRLNTLTYAMFAALPQVLDHVGTQIITHYLLIPVGLCQEPLHAVRVRVSQFLGHLPAVLAFDRGQQPAQVASHPAAHLSTLKARGYSS